MDWAKWLQLAGAVVLGASVALNVIAPLTKNKWDNKLLKGLKWALEKLALNKKLP